MLKFNSHKNTAIVIGIFTSILSVIFQLLVINKDFNEAWKLIIITSLLFFIIVYITVAYLLKKTIKEKIKPILKTIKQVKKTEIYFNDSNIEDKNIISEIEKDVEIWANSKTQEIAQLKLMEKYRKEFLGNIFHELKTPIFNIQGYISTLLDGGLEDNNINRRFLTKADKSIDRMISIVEDLNSISNLESGELKLNIEIFDIVELIKDVIELQENRTIKKEIKINIENTNPVFVEADKKLLMQVITNLIVNSINYGKENGETKIFITIKNNKSIVNIKDNGIGIKAEHISRLFERFYRVDKSRSKDSGGTGLGLAICKHIIEAHNQNIFVESEFEQGTTFSFTLNNIQSNH